MRLFFSFDSKYAKSFELEKMTMLIVIDKLIEGKNLTTQMFTHTINGHKF